MDSVDVSSLGGWLRSRPQVEAGQGQYTIVAEKQREWMRDQSLNQVGDGRRNLGIPRSNVPEISRDASQAVDSVEVTLPTHCCLAVNSCATSVSATRRLPLFEVDFGGLECHSFPIFPTGTVRNCGEGRGIRGKQARGGTP